MSFILSVSPLSSVHHHGILAIYSTWSQLVCYPCSTATQTGGGLLKVTLQAAGQEGKQPTGFLFSHIV